MKILHCADIHLDSKLNSNFEQSKSAERRYELLISFKKLVEYASDKQIQAVIIAGDLFDTGEVSLNTIREVAVCIKEHPQITFYYLKGNHDESDGLELGNIPNLKMFKDTWTDYCADETLGIHICGAANPDAAPVLEESAVNIVVLHGQVSEGGGNKEIDLPVYRHRGIDYLALGHIHKFVMSKLDERGVYCYPGCLESRGFDECDEHGVVILTIDEGRKITREFLPWGKRRAYRIEVDLSGLEDISDCLKRIKETLDNKGIKAADMVEIVLTGELDKVMNVSPDYLSTVLSEEYYCVRLKDKTKIRIDINEYTRDISLKSEFIKMVMEDSGLDEEEKAEIIRTGLLALAGEAI